MMHDCSASKTKDVHRLRCEVVQVRRLKGIFPVYPHEKSEICRIASAEQLCRFSWCAAGLWRANSPGPIFSENRSPCGK